MRTAHVVYDNRKAGLLTELEDGRFKFQYDSDYLKINKPHYQLRINFGLELQKEPYYSDSMFIEFENLLPEGQFREKLCHAQGLDVNDSMGLLVIYGAGMPDGLIVAGDIKKALR
ncbi:HipA N-terminal domain-containing protein (plasmid) [Neptuniibacter sp. QD72_48]|uniref:HipA N-terminal domain-containing protein n=1 Tax=Neptuniibacter sp. QD72_48 TaxID=3398214 RepID=UPI0039F5CD7F